MEEVKLIAKEIKEKLIPYDRKAGGNTRGYILKESMLMYCSLKMYAIPHKKPLWVNVQNYIMHHY